MKIPEKGDPQVVVWAFAGAGLFILLSFTVPATFHYAQPADHYYDVQQVEVQVNESNPCAHNMNTVSWARYKTDVEVDATLIKVQSTSGQKEQKVMEEWVYEETVDKGVQDIRRIRKLSDPLDPGIYRYKFDVKFHTPYGWKKVVSQNSHRFGVHHGDENASSSFPESGHVASYPQDATCAQS